MVEQKENEILQNIPRTDSEDKGDLSVDGLKARRLSRAVTVCAELFLERGIESVKMTDIAESSGVGVATLYRYFGTKTGIAIEAMTFLWNDVNDLYKGVFESEPFISQDGLKQLLDLMKMFIVLYRNHTNFMRLVGEFDRFVIHEGVPPMDLAEYERSVINFMPVTMKAFEKGVKDGTIREGIDFQLFYLTFAHALNELSKKFIYGEVLPSEDFSEADRELELLIDAARYYLKND